MVLSTPKAVLFVTLSVARVQLPAFDLLTLSYESRATSFYILYTWYTWCQSILEKSGCVLMLDLNVLYYVRSLHSLDEESANE